MLFRKLLPLLIAVALLGMPGGVLAEDAESDPLDQLPESEAQFVRATRGWQATVLSKLAPLQSSLAAPASVGWDEWAPMGSAVAQAAASWPPAPDAYVEIEEVHDAVLQAAYYVSDSTHALGADYPELGARIIDMAVNLSAANEAVQQLGEWLATDVKALEYLVLIRAAEFEEREKEEQEQEEEIKTGTGLADLLGISLDPYDYCFIATAAYGTPAAVEVQALRDFRDDVLVRSEAGRNLVDFYYAASPPLAEFIAQREGLRTVVRECLLDPVVWLVSETRGLWTMPG